MSWSAHLSTRLVTGCSRSCGAAEAARVPDQSAQRRPLKDCNGACQRWSAVGTECVCIHASCKRYCMNVCIHAPCKRYYMCPRVYVCSRACRRMRHTTCFACMVHACMCALKSLSALRRMCACASACECVVSLHQCVVLQAGEQQLRSQHPEELSSFAISTVLYIVTQELIRC